MNLQREGGRMKKITLVLAFLILVSVMDAKVTRARRSSILDIEPRFTFYTDFDDTQFGIGGDLIFNPFKRIGVRVELAELLFNEGTVFFLNHGVLKIMPKLDVLVYLPARQIQPYIHTGFGLVTGDGATYLIMGGGLGADYYVSRNMALSFEPGLYFAHASNGTSDSDLLLRLTAGAKFSILP
jgi:hypothetical protein